MAGLAILIRAVAAAPRAIAAKAAATCCCAKCLGGPHVANRARTLTNPLVLPRSAPCRTFSQSAKRDDRETEGGIVSPIKTESHVQPNETMVRQTTGPSHKSLHNLTHRLTRHPRDQRRRSAHGRGSQDRWHHPPVLSRRRRGQGSRHDTAAGMTGPQPPRRSRSSRPCYRSKQPALPRRGPGTTTPRQSGRACRRSSHLNLVRGVATSE